MYNLELKLSNLFFKLKREFIYLLLMVIFSASLRSFSSAENTLSATESKEFTLSPLIEVSSRNFLNKNPSLAIDKETGIVWVTWSSVRNKKEAIFLNGYDSKNNKWILNEEIQVSSISGNEFQPEIVLYKNGNLKKLFIVWTAKREGNWNIYCRDVNISDNILKLGSEVKISELAGINWQPAISVDNKNSTIWVVWESKPAGEKNFSIYCRCLSRGIWVDPFCISQLNEEKKNKYQAEKDCFRPTIVCDKKGRVYISWDRYEGQGNYEVYLAIIESDRKKTIRKRRVTYHPAIDASPTLAIDNNNCIWIAWHSNRRGEEDEYNPDYDLIKWIYLQCYDYEKDKFYSPVCAPLGRNLEKTGTDQGLEFPKLLIDYDGRIWIFARASHNFYMQYYHGNSWSSLYRLPPDGWGGRGLFAKADADQEGNIWIVRRDLNNNFLQKISGLPKKAKVKTKLKLAKEDKKVNLLYRSENLESSVPKSNQHFKIDEYNVYFGDIHAHSVFSDGIGPIDEFYIRCRDIYNYNFAALTDHDFFINNGISPTEWEQMKVLADHYYEPGKFVTFYAYEWTSLRIPRGYGHKNIYFISPDCPLLSHSENEYSTDSGLVNALKKYGGIAIPHHIGWTGVDWESIKNYPDIFPVVEIVSVHGAYEYMGNEPIKHRGGLPGYFIQDGLKRGGKFGLIGSSDGHGLIYHHSVSYRRNCWTTGLCAILAKELTRESLFDALCNKRVYATTGNKLILDFRIDGHYQGEEIVTTKTPTIQVNVMDTTKLRWVILVRNNKDLHYYGGEGTQCTYTYDDKEIPVGTSYYYLRIVFDNGNMAWSSPIWVHYKPLDKETLTEEKKLR